MAKNNIKHREGRIKRRVFLKVVAGEGHTKYLAAYEGLEIEGVTKGGKDDVKEVLRRIIRAPNEPPDAVVRAAILVVNHIMSAVHSDVREVVSGVGIDLSDDNEMLKLKARLRYYVDNKTDHAFLQTGWTGVVVASFFGHDGIAADSNHKVIKRVEYGRELDVIGLYRELVRVARHAYNAWSSY
jgi:hypothetical protein